MEALLYFFVSALVFALLMSSAFGAHVRGQGNDGDEPIKDIDNSPLRWIPPENDRDPVCGKMVSTETAKPSLHDGYVYYFCSSACRENFEAEPVNYLSDSEVDPKTDLVNNKMEVLHDV